MKNEKKITTREPGSKLRFFPRSMDKAFCARCEKPVDLFRFDEAAAFYNTTIVAVAALGESGGLHRIQTSFGEVLICSDSLLGEFSRRETQKNDADLLPRLI